MIKYLIFIMLMALSVTGCEKGTGACTRTVPDKSGDPRYTAFYCEQDVRKDDCSGRLVDYYDDSLCKQLGYNYKSESGERWYGPGGKYPRDTMEKNKFWIDPPLRGN